EVVRAVAQPPAGEPDSKRIHRAPAQRAPMLDVFADGGERAPQPTLHGGLREADLKGYLPVGQTAEVRKLDHLLVLGRQRTQRVVDGVADHGAREVLPGMRPLFPLAPALDAPLP